MDLATIKEIARPSGRDNLPEWRRGDAWLAGGTWLFSEPQPGLSRLIDLDGMGWTALALNGAGLEIAATCRIADLYAFEPPEDWIAASLFRQCCDALLASFKIWNAATVGGNLCLALPAGALTALMVALDGTCTIWRQDGSERDLRASDFVTGIGRNTLEPGELLRAITLPVAALRSEAACRRASHTRHGRSTAFLIATRCPTGGRFSLTLTAATVRPVRLDFPSLPQAAELRAAIDDAVPQPRYFDDAHATSEYRRQMTYHLAEEARQALAAEAGECR